MRITTSMIGAQQITGLQSNVAALLQAQNTVSTGKRINVASDDPTGALGVMTTDNSLRALDQYRTNVERATSRVSTEDSVLQDLGDLVTRAKELGIAQSGDTATDQTRQVAGAEVNQLFEQIVTLANTKFGNEYLFGGDQSQTQPFTSSGAGGTLDYTTTNPQGQRTIAVDDNQALALTHDGSQVFLNTGVLDAVKSLAHSLDPTSVGYGTAGIRAALKSLDDAYNSLQAVVGDAGARANRLTVTSQNLDALKTNLTTFKSSLQDVDIETAMTELTNRQIAYQGALLATSKVTGLSLTDYLR